MYKRVYHILVLDDDTLALYQTVTLLKQRDYMVLAAAKVDQARWWISQWPIDLLIVSARLRGIGGLQFIATLRAEHPEMAAILIAEERHGMTDMSAWRHGAVVVVRPYDPAEFLMVVAEKLASIRRRQRWPRKRVTTRFAVRVQGETARLMDVSYGGVRLQFDRSSYKVPSQLTIDIPTARLQVHAELVWSARGDDGVSYVCGAAILDDAPPERWRHFVDGVAQETA